MNFLFEVKRFIKNIFQKRSAIYELAKRDFQAQNKNTYLGIIWGYIQPLTYIFLVVLVFNLLLRTNPGKSVPFAVFLITGMLAWQFFSGTIVALTGVIKSYAFLVTKGDFNLGILHLAKLLSAMIPHLILVIVTFVVCWFNHIPPHILNLQVLYYFFCLLMLLLGLGWITSATSLFIPDVVNIISIVIQFGFWITPIFWDIENVSSAYRWIFKLNPLFYIVSGYRDSMVYFIPFWQRPFDTIYFWCFTLLVLLIGIIVFRRLKPHFGEVI